MTRRTLTSPPPCCCCCCAPCCALCCMAPLLAVEVEVEGVASSRLMSWS
jgi:hypothetical protein